MQTAYRNRPFPPPAFPQRTDTQGRARSTSRPRNDDRGYATDNYSYTPRSNYDNSYINTSSQSQRGGNYSRHANSATVNSYTTSTSGQRPNHVRQQQSLASFPSQPSSSRAHHSHSNSEVPMRSPPNRGYNQPNPPFSMASRRTPSLTSSNTASSTSSANSSFLERMKPGSGNSTSRTSFETDAGGNSPQNTSSNRKPWNDGDAEAGPGECSITHKRHLCITCVQESRRNRMDTPAMVILFGIASQRPQVISPSMSIWPGPQI